METELIRILDEYGQPLGIATREEVHKKGYWHETFHCWFISRENNQDYIYFQKRSPQKKDYPNLLDITAAGHILSHETVYDGIREVKEEIGVDVQMNELISLGVIQYSVKHGDLMDNELANVFLYNYKKSMNDFILQMEEVSGIVKADFSHFCEFIFGKETEIRVHGFEINQDGERVVIDQTLDKTKFAPHENSYYQKVLTLISENLIK